MLKSFNDFRPLGIFRPVLISFNDFHFLHWKIFDLAFCVETDFKICQKRHTFDKNSDLSKLSGNVSKKCGKIFKVQWCSGVRPAFTGLETGQRPFLLRRFECCSSFMSKIKLGTQQIFGAKLLKWVENLSKKVDRIF